MPYTTTTLSEIRERLRDKYEQVPFWDQEEARLAINEALLVWGLFTGFWKQRVTIATIPNQYLYGLPSSLIYRMRVEFSTSSGASAGTVVESTGREDLDNGRPRWRQETTASGGSVPTAPAVWVPVSLQSIYLWPAHAVGSGSLILDGVSATPILVDDPDTIDVGDDLLTALLGYALHVLAFERPGPWFAGTFSYFVDFLKLAGEQNSQIKTSQIYRRALGQDYRWLKPLTGVPTQIDRLAAQVTQG